MFAIAGALRRSTRVRARAYNASLEPTDADAAATKLAELGGKLLMPPTTVPDMVRFAVAIDPQGASFSVEAAKKF